MKRALTRRVPFFVTMLTAALLPHPWQPPFGGFFGAGRRQRARPSPRRSGKGGGRLRDRACPESVTT
jgi:hypothetical protein